MSETGIELIRQGAVATLWLNRPSVHNAFDEHLIAELTQELYRIDSDQSVRVLVIAGRGKNFCAGADLAWMQRIAGYSEAENLRDASALAEMYRALSQLSKPTIARVHGAALGGGTGLVAACDMALATPAASFGTTEVRLGLIPATIAPYVIAAIGARASHRYFLTGERFNAEVAQRLGLVNEVCSPEQLDGRIFELSNELLLGGPAAQAASKKLIAELGNRPVTAQLIADSSARIANVRAGAEAKEGLRAFFDKRKAAWNSEC
jgi:methylglutaconyl-CoA hydratase